MKKVRRPQVRVYNAWLVEGKLSRDQIVSLINHYVDTKPQLKRFKTIIVRFEEQAECEGEKVGGWQLKNKIVISSLNSYAKPYDVFRLVTYIYHELAHMAEMDSARAELKYKPSRDPEERRAVRESVHMMSGWVERQAEEQVIAWLKYLSSEPSRWDAN